MAGSAGSGKRKVSLPPLAVSPEPDDEPISQAIPRRLSRINRRRQSYIDLAEKAADLLQYPPPTRGSLGGPDSLSRTLSLSLIPNDADWETDSDEDTSPKAPPMRIHNISLQNLRGRERGGPPPRRRPLLEKFISAVEHVLANLRLIKSLPENRFDTEPDSLLEIFRRAVKHVIILNKAGMKVKKVLQNGRERVTRDSEGLAEDTRTDAIVFNLNAFMAQFQLEVSPEAKRVMMRMPSERTERDLRKLHKLVSGLKCFEKYSKSVRHELCRVIRYERHETGRIVIRQGDAGRSFYFILSGSVRVNVKETDPLTGRSFTKQVDELHKGDSFGELALLKNITRQATIICKEPTEFLSLDKEDFQGILTESHSQELEEKIAFLRSTELMSSWPEELVRTVCETSQVKDFKAKSVLLRTHLPSDWLYLVRRGRCEAMKAVETRRGHVPLPPVAPRAEAPVGPFMSPESMRRFPQSPEKTPATPFKGPVSPTKAPLSPLKAPTSPLKVPQGPLSPEKQRKTKSGDELSGDELLPSSKVPQHGQTVRCPRRKTVKVFLRVKTFSAGDFFSDNTVVNFGRDVSIVSSERIECILISKVAFYRRAMQKSLEIIKRHSLEVPSDEDILRSYCQQRDWALYKRQVISSVLARASQHQFR